MSDSTPTGETGEAKPYRIDYLFDGALESRDHFADREEAIDQFDFSVSEYAGNNPDKHWQIDLYDETAEPPELIDSHEHEAEDEYEVTFSVRVHAEDEGEAERAAQDFLEQLSESMIPADKVEIVTSNSPRTLWVLDEWGATFVFPFEIDARQAIVDERGRGMHAEQLTELLVPRDDHQSYAEAVRDNLDESHLHPVFVRADRRLYPTIRVERLCAGLCSEEGDTDACERATRFAPGDAPT